MTTVANNIAAVQRSDDDDDATGTLQRTQSATYRLDLAAVSVQSDTAARLTTH